MTSNKTHRFEVPTLCAVETVVARSTSRKRSARPLPASATASRPGMASRAELEHAYLPVDLSDWRRVLFQMDKELEGHRRRGLASLHLEQHHLWKLG